MQYDFCETTLYSQNLQFIQYGHIFALTGYLSMSNAFISNIEKTVSENSSLTE